MSKSDYNALPYESFPFAGFHPQRLSVISQLFGLTTPKLDKFRYLEIGCAAGGNLIPLAIEYEQAEFVGIDYAEIQINDGQRVIDDLALNNVRLKTQDILDVTNDLGQFDFIIAHGVYSWVPIQVREKLICLCRDHLSPEGIACISYNTQPGWKVRSAVRDMLRHKTQDCVDLKTRAHEAKAFAQVMLNSFQGNPDSYAVMMKSELQQAYEAPLNILVHDYLADINNPVYFHQFNEEIASASLKYIGDTHFYTMRVLNLTDEITTNLANNPESAIEMEQYTDYATNRYFRRSLITHTEQNVQRLVQKEAYSKLCYSLSSQPKPVKANLQAGIQVAFSFGAGTTISSKEPMIKFILSELSSHWPKTLSYDALLKTARTKLKNKVASSALSASLSEQLHSLYGQNFIDAYVHKLNLVNKAGEKPKVNPLVCYQAKHQNWVTNQRHERRALDDFSRNLIQLLDGTRTKKELRQALEVMVQSGILPLLDEHKNPVTDKAVIAQAVRNTLDNSLKILAGHALLVG